MSNGSGKLSVAKVIFGAEPRDREVYQFVLRRMRWLKFSTGMEAVVREDKRNPKRIQRQARKQTQCTGIGTKPQQAQRREVRKEKKEAEQLRKFAMKQQKKKEKHKGR